MSDERKESDSQDSRLIDIQQMLDLAYWARRFNVSQRDLKDAVEAVGPQASAVSHYLSGVA